MFVHTTSLIGKRDSNEDQHVVIKNMDGGDSTKHKINYFAVYDGHGGKKVSKYLKDNLAGYFVRKSVKYHPGTTPQGKYTKYINKVYDIIQKKFTVKSKHISEHCGSTALVVIQYPSKSGSGIYVINLGDCRVVLCNKYNIGQQLTKDHKPNAYEERIRIESLGGVIKFDGDYRIDGLSVSRVFGDLDARDYITNVPEIFKYSVSKTDKFMILACDGLWDVLSNQDATDFVLAHMTDKLGDQTGSSSKNIAKKLAEYAIERGSFDNVSVIIVFL